MDRPEVLITEGGSGASRAALAVSRSLGRAGFSPVVTVSDRRQSYAARSRHSTRWIEVPRLDVDSIGYAAAIRQESRTRQYLVVFPSSDDALRVLRPDLLPLIDKVSVAALAAEAGFDTPDSLVLSEDELHEARRDLPYPVIAKPNLKVTLARLLVGPDDVNGLPRHEGISWLIQPFLKDQMRGLVGAMWDGQLISATHIRYQSLWPWPLGTVASGITGPPDRDIEEKAERLLAKYSGVFHMDFAGKTLLDLNLRIHATNALAAAAGSDAALSFCRAIAGEKVQPTRAREGVPFRWVEAATRSVLSALKAGQLTWVDGLRLLAPRRGTVHSVFSLRDPAPLMARASQIRHRLFG